MRCKVYTCDINYGPRIDERLCTGCGECYDMCPLDIFGWDEERNMPTVAHPGECSICCFCETTCPSVAIDVHLPLHQMLDFGIMPTSLSKDSKYLDSLEKE